MVRSALTVVIPAYNRQDFIAEIIECVSNQEMGDIEIIVVDDGSTDGTAARASEFQNVRVLRKPNGGPASARNFGLEHARGEYIAFIDSDDLWVDGALVRLVDTLEKDDEADLVMGLPKVMARSSPEHPFELSSSALAQFPYSISGTVFRRSVFSKVGTFDPDLWFGEDVDWFHRAQNQGIRAMRLDFESVIFRRHEKNLTNGKGLVELNVLKVFKKSLDRKRSAQ